MRVGGRLRRGGALLLAGGLPVSACLPDDGLPRGTPLEIEAPPELAVGEPYGDPLREFQRVVSPFLLPDGKLAVPVGAAAEIRVFDREGGHVASLGGAGRGPGEFEGLFAAWPRGDTIEAFDPLLRRITRFLPDGTPEVVNLAPIAASLVPVPGALEDGWILAEIAGIESEGRDRVVFHRFDRGGSHRGEIAETQGLERHRANGFTRLDPLSPRAVYALGAAGLHLGETLTPEIRILGGDGSPVREVAWEVPGAPPVREAFRTVAEEAAERAGAGQAEGVRAQLEALPLREDLSVFWDLMVDEEGFVWILPYEPGRHAAVLGGARLGRAGPGGEWTVFSPEGERVGAVEVPPDLEPYWIGRDAVVGIQRDRLGIETVRVHRVVRR